MKWWTGFEPERKEQTANDRLLNSFFLAFFLLFFLRLFPSFFFSFVSLSFFPLFLLSSFFLPIPPPSLSFFGLAIWSNGISTFVGYLTPKPVYIYIYIYILSPTERLFRVAWHAEYFILGWKPSWLHVSRISYHRVIVFLCVSKSFFTYIFSYIRYLLQGVLN